LSKIEHLEKSVYSINNIAAGLT